MLRCDEALPQPAKRGCQGRQVALKGGVGVDKSLWIRWWAVTVLGKARVLKGIGGKK